MGKEAHGEAHGSDKSNGLLKGICIGLGIVVGVPVGCSIMTNAAENMMRHTTSGVQNTVAEISQPAPPPPPNVQTVESGGTGTQNNYKSECNGLCITVTTKDGAPQSSSEGCKDSPIQTADAPPMQDADNPDAGENYVRLHVPKGHNICIEKNPDLRIKCEGAGGVLSDIDNFDANDYHGYCPFVWVGSKTPDVISFKYQYRAF